MEAAGAVFLPAAGYRSGTNVIDTGTYGHYWSSSYYNAACSYGLYLYPADLYTMRSTYGMAGGLSVRLVQELR